MGTAVFIIVVILATAAIVAYRSGGKAENARLRGYGIVVDGDVVKSHGKQLGPLSGAHAEIAGFTQRHTLTRTVTVVGAFTKKTDATLVITMTNGNIHTFKIKDATAFRQAAQWTAKFNALAQASVA
jgi:hypothetical protein